MNAKSPRQGPANGEMAGKPQATTLADAFARYADLLFHQLEALDRGDLETFRRLADDRTGLASSIDELESTAGPIDPASLESIRRELRRCAGVDQKLRQRIGKLRKQTGGEIQDVEKAQHRTRKYSSGVPRGTRFDVSF